MEQAMIYIAGGILMGLGAIGSGVGSSGTLLSRSTDEEKQSQLRRLREFEENNR